MLNDIVEIEISDVTREGMGIGHYDGMAVFVENAVPGDVVLCKITKQKKSFALGSIVKILNASKSRIKSECAFSNSCGGCTFWDMDYATELQIKARWVTDALKRIGKIDAEVLPIIGAPSIYNYRNKTQFPVGKDAKGKTISGFYARGSHDIVSIDDCKISSASANIAANIIRDFIDNFSIPTYDEKTKVGLIRHIYIRTSKLSDEVVVILVVNRNTLPHHEELIQELKDSLKGFCGLVLNINEEDTNLVLGEKCVTLYGKDYIKDELLGVEFHVSPLSFYQVNSRQAENIYELVRCYADLSKSDTVLDLYCGIGTMALIMAKDAGKAVGIEIVREAVEDAKLCAKLNNIENAEFICSDASNAVALLKARNLKPNVIIVDPPRKGCDAETLKAISDLSPQKLIYVSCDPATLARDLKILAESGFEVKSCQPFDMFPRTPHVECVALMTNCNK